MGHFLYNLPQFNAAVWHTQRMANFVTIFLWRFIAPVWHSLYNLNQWRDADFFNSHATEPSLFKDFSCIVLIFINVKFATMAFLIIL